MYKPLYKSRNNRMIAGVAGGLGEYLDVDPVFIRILFVVTTLFWGTGLLIYLIMWIVVPSYYDAKIGRKSHHFSEHGYNCHGERADTYYEHSEESSDEIGERHSKGRYLFGIILISVGLMWMLDFLFPVFDFELIWPVLLIITGGFLLFGLHRGQLGQRQ